MSSDLAPLPWGSQKMADRNTYIKYKRDQRLLVYWIAHTSNQIIKTSFKAPVAVNTTGEVSLATLKSLSFGRKVVAVGAERPLKRI